MSSWNWLQKNNIAKDLWGRWWVMRDINFLFIEKNVGWDSFYWFFIIKITLHNKTWLTWMAFEICWMAFRPGRLADSPEIMMNGRQICLFWEKNPANFRVEHKFHHFSAPYCSESKIQHPIIRAVGTLNTTLAEIKAFLFYVPFIQNDEEKQSIINLIL